MFRFTKKPSSGNHSQYLAKTTSVVQCRYRRRTDGVSAMAAQYDLCGVYIVHSASVYACTVHNTHIYAVHNTHIYTERSLYFQLSTGCCSLMMVSL